MNRTITAMWIALTLVPMACQAATDGANKPKIAGALSNSALVETARANAAKYPWAAAIQQDVVKNAQPWMQFSDDQLWDLIFGNTITRSWMVWSSGYCPSCKKSVPMYQWVCDGIARPWKVQCPHCKELFPKNDFHKFYKSGLDEHGIFDPKRADRSLLFNLEHPAPSDPLHLFGVDDGEGYVEGENRWRFIGAYLIYGQWKKTIHAGITNLAAAYAATGDRKYAHKAAVLLDRLADLYPTFDFKAQAYVYEKQGAAGYISTWHDACEELRTLVLAYDQVFEGMAHDDELVAFLSQKARRCGLDNPKSSVADIRRNIEDRILRDSLANRAKIESNYPQTDFAVALTKTVLGWPGNREEVMAVLDGVLAKATAVDGQTGERGLTVYGAWSPKSVANILMQYARVDPQFLPEMFKRHPKLYDSYRFFLDVWCLGQSYYPNIGDCGTLGRKTPVYAGVIFSKSPGLTQSGFDFMWELYKQTNDPAFVQLLYWANGRSLEGLPHSLFTQDPAAFQADVKGVIDREGEQWKLPSTNKQEWHLAILRSGRDGDERDLWTHYQAYGNHGHSDCMNLGLFAEGLDLLPDFGYPQVQYGGWESPKARWYTNGAAHNTVVVDGSPQAKGAAKTTLWADGKDVHAVRVSGPEVINGKQYERTLAMVDMSATDSYVIDVFRVVGGTQHSKFTHAYYGTITPNGLALGQTADYGHGAVFRDSKADRAPKPGWSVDWRIEDRYKLLPEGADLHLRYTDLTLDAEAMTTEGWVSEGLYTSYNDLWIPFVVTRRTASKAPLASTFVSILEPYEKSSGITGIRRLPLQTASGQPYPDPNVALMLQLADGRTDLFIAADVENPLASTPAYDKQAVLTEKSSGLRVQGEMCLVRRDRQGKVTNIALCNGRSVAIGKTRLTMANEAGFIEIQFAGGAARVISGKPGDIAELVLDGQAITP